MYGFIQIQNFLYVEKFGNSYKMMRGIVPNGLQNGMNGRIKTE